MPERQAGERTAQDGLAQRPRRLAMHESSKEPSLMYATENGQREFTTALRRATPPRKFLLPSFQFRGDQANFIDARAAHDVDGARNVLKHYIVIAFDESNFLGALFKNISHARAKSFPGDFLVINLELGLIGFGIGHNLHDDRFIVDF